MNVKDAAEKLGAEIVNGADLCREIENGYAGDFLSNTISKAGESAAWFTVMNNVNVAAVASLIDCACIVLCEGVKPDAALLDKARQNEVNILSVADDVFTAARKL